MLNHRTKRRVAGDARAAKRLAEIEGSIVTLSDDDLLDLADTVRGEPRTPLSESASAEMVKRKITLWRDAARQGV